jgi:acyl carrier protein
MMIVIGIIFVGLLLFVVFPLFRINQEKKEVETFFHGREALDDYAFYARYYKPKGIPLFIVIKVREILADKSGIDLSRLNPDDDLGSQPGFQWKEDADANFEIILEFESEFGISLTDADVDAMNTIDDMIRIIYRKLQERNP